MNNRKILLLRGSLVLMAATIGILFFFRQFIFSGGEWVTGDMADGRLLVAIHEHWFRFLQGKEAWHDLGFFYPDRNALIYSDTFLLGGMAHALFRSAGYDPYMAFQLTQILMSLAGFAGMFTWLLAYRRLGFGYALFGAFLFLIASPIYLGTRNSHIQLQGVWLIPWVLVLMEQAWRDVNRPGFSLAVSFGACCLLYGLIAYSTFYVAWFFLLFFLLWFVSALILYGWKACWVQFARLIQRWRTLLPGCLIAAGLLSLFLVTYLPARLEQGGRPIEAVIISIPHLPDFFNHSATNLLWGNIFSYLHEYRDAYRWELELGPTLLFGICLFAFAFSFLRQRGNKTDPDVVVRRITALAILFSFLLIFRMGKTTLWTIPYHIVPGASGIRAVFRYNVLLTIPSILLVLSGMKQLRHSVPGLHGYVFVTLLGTLILLEQGQTAPIGRMNRTEDLKVLASLPPPPADAEAFVAYGNYPHEYASASIQSGAIIYAQHWDLPTVSGRSGFSPAGWDLVAPRAAEVHERVRGWCRSRGITGKVYLFNNDILSWGPAVHLKDDSVQLQDMQLDLLTVEYFPSLRLKGWSILEEFGVWSIGSRSEMTLPPVADAPYPLILDVQLQGFVVNKNPRQQLQVLLDGVSVFKGELTQEDSWKAFSITIPRKGMLLEFRVDSPASPKETGISNDGRELGIALHKLIIHSP